MKASKIIVTAAATLKEKYGKKTTAVKALLTRLKKSDKARGIATRVVYIDQAGSAKSAGVKAIKNITAAECKRMIDDLYKKHAPDYIVLLGAQDIIPFVELNNPAAEDDDAFVPSDLPYACDTAYSKNVQNFIGPTRVVGRIPDIPGNSDPAYLTGVINSIIQYKPLPQKQFQQYFAISAKVWQQSTRQTLQHIFGDDKPLLLSPGSSVRYTKTQLKKRTHFFNCHGAAIDTNYYGQQGNQYPVAIASAQLSGKITAGTIAVAECCYGAELVRQEFLPDNTQLSIANNYFAHQAIAFMGSSNIAYGPPDGQGLADLITQFFMKNVLAGASTGRALLQARQQFLTESAPHLDPYELKTLAQFHLLGDPSLLPVTDDTAKKIVSKETIQNSRIKLLKKGSELHNNLVPCHRAKSVTASANQKQINTLLKQTGFSNADKKGLYKTDPKTPKAAATVTRKMAMPAAQFRTFVKENSTPRSTSFNNTRVLVIKESGSQVLGWRVYERK